MAGDWGSCPKGSAEEKGDVMIRGQHFGMVLAVACLSVTTLGQQPTTQLVDESTLLRTELNLLRSKLDESGNLIENLRAENAALSDQVRQLQDACKKAGIDLPSTTSSKSVVAMQPVALPDAKTRALYNKYKCKYALIDGKYVRLPDFDLRYQNSRKGAPFPPRRMSINKQLQDALRKTWPVELPTLGVGEFGQITDPKVFQILGPDEMLVTEVGDFGQQEEVVRLKGWSTEGLVDGARLNWRRNPPSKGGTSIAIIGTWQYANTIGAARTIFNAIPVEQVRAGLTVEQFADMLKIGIDPDKAGQEPPVSSKR